MTRMIRHDRRSPRAARLAILGLLAALCGAAGPVPSTRAQEMIDGIAAVVNTDVIMLSDLQTAMADETLRLQARYDGETLRKRLAQAQYAILNRMIERRLQLQAALEKQVTVTDEEVDEVWERVRNKTVSLPPWLTPSREVVRDELRLRRLADFAVQRRIVIPFEELRAYYLEQELQFTKPAAHRIRQILLLPRAHERMTEVRERAEELERQLRAGADFAELAGIYSDGPAKDRGGDLGFVRKEDLLEPLGAAFDALTPGEHSPVIATDAGMHILMREETRAGDRLPFDEVKEEIRKALYQQKRQQAYTAWLASLKDKSYIDIRL